MKKMLLNKKNLYIKLTAVLILMIVGILGIYTAFVQKIATGQCFNILDDSRERMGQMIVNDAKRTGSSGSSLVSAEKSYDGL